MTTEPTPDLCCTHGEALVQRVDRALELLESRKAKVVPREEPSELTDAIRGAVRSSGGDTSKFATGGLVQGPGRPIIGGGVDCVFPIDAAMVRAANPSPAIDPQAIAEAVAEATIEELDRRGRLRF